MAKLRSWWIFYCKYAVPFILLVVLMIPIQGVIYPWKDGAAVLSRYSAQHPLLIGYSDHIFWIEGNDGSLKTTRASRHYLLASTLLSRPTMLTLESVNGGSPSATEANASYLLLVPFQYFFGFWCIWRFWLRPNA